MRSLIALQERLAISGNVMFRKATQLRRRLRAEQKRAVLEAWSIPGGMTIDRANVFNTPAYCPPFSREKATRYAAFIVGKLA